MKNSCPSRASSARPKSVLAWPALTYPRSVKWQLLPYKFLDLRYDLDYDAFTTFGPYEPEVWTAAASRMMQFVDIGYADPIEFLIENVGTFRMFGHPAFFTLVHCPQGYCVDEERNWSVIHFAVVYPGYYFKQRYWRPSKGLQLRFALDLIPDHERYGA